MRAKLNLKTNGSFAWNTQLNRHLAILRNGLPADNAPDAEAYSDEDSDGVILPASVQTGLLIYNPLTASYRVNDA